MSHDPDVRSPLRVDDNAAADLDERVTHMAQLLSVEAAAFELSIGRSTMFALLKSGAITSVRIGRLRRVPMDALRAYVKVLVAEQEPAA